MVIIIEEQMDLLQAQTANEIVERLQQVGFEVTVLSKPGCNATQQQEQQMLQRAKLHMGDASMSNALNFGIDWARPPGSISPGKIGDTVELFPGLRVLKKRPDLKSTTMVDPEATVEPFALKAVDTIADLEGCQMVQYQYKEISNTHFFRITPQSFYNDVVCLDIQQSIEDDWEDRYTGDHDETLCFITEDSLTELNKPQIARYNYE